MRQCVFSYRGPRQQFGSIVNEVQVEQVERVESTVNALEERNQVPSVSSELLAFGSSFGTWGNQPHMIALNWQESSASLRHHQ